MLAEGWLWKLETVAVDVAETANEAKEVTTAIC
jgi:hypothetical protein